MDTREWSDGVLTFAARQVVKEPQGKSAKAVTNPWFLIGANVKR